MSLASTAGEYAPALPIDAVGWIVGLLGLLLVAAWLAVLYR